MAGTDLEVTPLGLGWIASSAALTRVHHLMEPDAGLSAVDWVSPPVANRAARHGDTKQNNDLFRY
jgi:hypothetical protein